MRSSLALIGVLATSLSVASCGGSSTPAATPVAPSTTPAPTTTPSPTPTAITVSIVSSTLGSGSYVPDPVPANMGDTVAFKNNDVTTHHIVLDNGTADLGNLAPGATTSTITVSGTAALTFHCTIHPSMIGSINGLVAAPVPTPTPSPYKAVR
jgi:plastocyanin